MTKRTSVAVLTTVALLVASCGLGAEDQAEAIDEVQFELLGTSTSTTSTTVVASPRFAAIFYWHTAGDNRLKPVTRSLAEAPTPGQTLTDLVAGPTEEELEESRDVQTRLDQTMEPRLTLVEGNTYQIQIQWTEEQLTTEQAAEFVCTAVQFSEISAVTIVNQDNVPFPLSGTGAVPIAGPAKASDFNNCIEEPLLVDPETADASDGEGSDEDGGSTTTAP